MNTVYSFSDVTLVLSHPKVGKLTVTGQGIGSIAVSRSGDVTQHDVAADGSVMASKIVQKNGALALAIQQTSQANTWLRKWYNYLITAAAGEWIATTGTIKSQGTGETITLKGLSPQKMPDQSYQQTGQQVTWNLMATEITM